MWVPANFTEWARDPLHPFYRPGHPHDNNAISFMLDGREIKPEQVAVASMTNGYLRAYARKADGKGRMVEQVGKVSRFKTHTVKGRVDIMVRKEMA